MTTSTHTAPTDVDIVPRHMGFEFPKDTPKYWANDDPWTTHLLNALSITFPQGEAEFVRSVREVKDRVTAPKLLDEVRAFIAQEMHHSAEHEAFNDWLRSLGLPVDSIVEQITGFIEQNRRQVGKEANLAITVALEHFTAIMADAFLTEPEVLDEMHENVRWLWLWHGIEETEHKAVAFDVYQQIGGTYQMRVAIMAVVTRIFLRNTTMFHLQLLRQDGQLGNVRSFARYMWRFWGPRGRFTRLVPRYLQYYRRDFHPWQHDNRAAIEQWKAEVEKRAKRVGPGTRKRAVTRSAA